MRPWVSVVSARAERTMERDEYVLDLAPIVPVPQRALEVLGKLLLLGGDGHDGGEQDEGGDTTCRHV